MAGELTPEEIKMLLEPAPDGKEAGKPPLTQGEINRLLAIISGDSQFERKAPAGKGKAALEALTEEEINQLLAAIGG